jgi:hypothetical protein
MLAPLTGCNRRAIPRNANARRTSERKVPTLRRSAYGQAPCLRRRIRRNLMRNKGLTPSSLEIEFHKDVCFSATPDILVGATARVSAGPRRARRVGVRRARPRSLTRARLRRRAGLDAPDRPRAPRPVRHKDVPFPSRLLHQCRAAIRPYRDSAGVPIERVTPRSKTCATRMTTDLRESFFVRPSCRRWYNARV